MTGSIAEMSLAAVMRPTVTRVLRNTARMLEGPDGPTPAKNSYGAVGFRCARYLTPMRDVLTHALRYEMPLLPRDVELDASRGFGVERPAYARAGEEDPGKVFVTGRTAGVGFVPVLRPPMTIAGDGETGGGPVFLGYLHATAGVSYEVERVAPGASSKPWGIGGPSGLLLGLRQGRLAVFRLDVEGPRVVGLLRNQGGGPAVRPVSPGEARDLATLDREPEIVRFTAVYQGSKSRPDLWFTLSFELEVSAPDLHRGPWLETGSPR